MRICRLYSFRLGRFICWGLCCLMAGCTQSETKLLWFEDIVEADGTVNILLTEGRAAHRRSMGDLIVGGGGRVVGRGAKIYALTVEPSAVRCSLIAEIGDNSDPDVEFVSPRAEVVLRDLRAGSTTFYLQDHTAASVGSVGARISDVRLIGSEKPVLEQVGKKLFSIPVSGGRPEFLGIVPEGVVDKDWINSADVWHPKEAAMWQNSLFVWNGGEVPAVRRYSLNDGALISEAPAPLGLRLASVIRRDDGHWVYGFMNLAGQFTVTDDEGRTIASRELPLCGGVTLLATEPMLVAGVLHPIRREDGLTLYWWNYEEDTCITQCISTVEFSIDRR